jgi:hypothetical protein
MKGLKNIQWKNPSLGWCRAREGIELGWSHGFRLDELDVWQEWWWWTNLWLINWHPQMGQETLGASYKHVEEMVIGWGVWSWATIGVDRVEGGKGSTYVSSKGFGKM